MHYIEKSLAHGIMFHHFQSEVHPWSQGAITDSVLARVFEFIDPDRILPAHEWYERSTNGTLEPQDLCLTFDDSLLCQYDVACPVMADYGLTGFFFVYSSVFEGGTSNLEIYRYFRSVAFDSIDEFYRVFFDRMSSLYSARYRSAVDVFDPAKYLEHYPFFSDNDRLFRHLRDDVLIVAEYETIMDGLIEERGFDKRTIRDRLWMTDEMIKSLHDQGNIIGLHSYSHPMTMERFSPAIQQEEYEKNFRHLHGVLGEKPLTMSHPSNSYNSETIAILKKLGIKLGFRADMAEVPNRGELEFPRQDHTNVVNAMA